MKKVIICMGIAIAVICSVVFGAFGIDKYNEYNKTVEIIETELREYCVGNHPYELNEIEFVEFQTDDTDRTFICYERNGETCWTSVDEVFAPEA